MKLWQFWKTNSEKILIALTIFYFLLLFAGIINNHIEDIYNLKNKIIKLLRRKK